MTSIKRIRQELIVAQDRATFANASIARVMSIGSYEKVAELTNEHYTATSLVACYELMLEYQERDVCEWCGLPDLLVQYGDHFYCGACLDEAKD